MPGSINSPQGNECPVPWGEVAGNRVYGFRRQSHVGGQPGATGERGKRGGVSRARAMASRPTTLAAASIC
jgi:hypothetical protein